MSEVLGWAVHQPKQALELLAFNAGLLQSEEVEIAVDQCGICHSDLSCINSVFIFLTYSIIKIRHIYIGKIRTRIVLDINC